MNTKDITNCPYRVETHDCLDCYIERCPYVYEEETEEIKSSQKPALLIFKTLKISRPEYMKELRDELISQIKEGVVLLPAYMTVETVLPSDCEIRIVDKEGNVVEGGKVK